MKQPINVPISKTSYKLTEDFIYRQSLIEYKIHKGFIWDGASISPFLAWFMRRDGICRAASCIHDFLYTYGCIDVRYYQSKSKYFTGSMYTRKEADELFRDVLIESGYPKWKAKIAYRAVRMFGSKYWNGNA